MNARLLPRRPAGRPSNNKLPPPVEIPCGQLKRNPIEAIAYTAARKIARAGGGAKSLTIDPEGLAYLEPPHSACFEDVVGTYSGVMPFTLERQIHTDLKHFLELRACKRS